MNYFNKNKRSDSSRFGKKDSKRPDMHDAICDECGRKCKLPFKPTGDKPVYCSECFENRDTGGSRRPDRERRNFDKGRRDDRRDSSRSQMHSATCDECGDKCEVPFKPTNDKPIYCDNCFKGKRDGHKGSNKSGDENSRNDIKELKDQFKIINIKIDKILKVLDPAPIKESSPKKDKAETKKESSKKKTTTKKKAKK